MGVVVHTLYYILALASNFIFFSLNLVYKCKKKYLDIYTKKEIKVCKELDPIENALMYLHQNSNILSDLNPSCSPS